jgi:hypothetical protein
LRGCNTFMTSLLESTIQHPLASCRLAQFFFWDWCTNKFGLKSPNFGVTLRWASRVLSVHQGYLNREDSDGDFGYDFIWYVKTGYLHVSSRSGTRVLSCWTRSCSNRSAAMDFLRSWLWVSKSAGQSVSRPLSMGACGERWVWKFRQFKLHAYGMCWFLGNCWMEDGGKRWARVSLIPVFSSSRSCLVQIYMGVHYNWLARNTEQGYKYSRNKGEEEPNKVFRFPTQWWWAIARCHQFVPTVGMPNCRALDWPRFCGRLFEPSTRNKITVQHCIFSLPSAERCLEIGFPNFSTECELITKFDRVSVFNLEVQKKKTEDNICDDISRIVECKPWPESTCSGSKKFHSVPPHHGVSQLW